MRNSKPNKHATGCDVDYDKSCNCSLHPRYRQKILDKIHLAVRTEFFDRNRKNMEFLADDIEAWHKAEIAKEKQERIEKNKSFCGCPMCLHHTEPYKLEKTDE